MRSLILWLFLAVSAVTGMASEPNQPQQPFQQMVVANYSFADSKGVSGVEVRYVNRKEGVLDDFSVRRVQILPGAVSTTLQTDLPRERILVTEREVVTFSRFTPLSQMEQTGSGIGSLVLQRKGSPDLRYVALYEVLSKNVGDTRHFLLITKAFMGQNIYTLSEEYRDGEYHLPLSSVEQVADLAGNILYSRLIERVP